MTSRPESPDKTTARAEAGEPTAGERDAARGTSGGAKNGLTGNEETVLPPPPCPPTPPPRPPSLGAGRYEAQSLLGEGGMGQVWLSRDVRIGRDVALKRLLGEHVGAAGKERRFLREARIQALMEHPAVVPVYDLESAEDGSTYFTMRRVRGRSLEDILRDLAAADPATVRLYSRRKLLTALVNVCLAVHYAHTHGIVHRDLKPANIMLGEFGEVYLLDWGVAKIVRPSVAPDEPPAGDEPLPFATTRGWAARTAPAPLHPDLVQSIHTGESGGLTQTGDAIGTIGYMAPEQLEGREVDARADVYSLGAILCEIATFRPMHQGLSVMPLYARMSQDSLLDPPALDGVAPELADICRRATTFKPERRIAGARELADAVERYLDGDRDLAARRKAATELARSAAAAAERAFSPATTATAATEAHAEAMQAAVRALAFDPEHATARRTLARLLVEPPEQLPQAAEAAQREATRNARFNATRIAAWGFLSWLAVVPYTFLMGIRDPRPIGLIAAALVLGLGLVAYYHGTRNPGPGALFGLLGLALVCVSLFSAWLGPFILVPVAAASATFMFVTQATPRERPFVVALGVLAAAAPLLAEWLGLVPPSYAFVGGNLVLFPRGMELPATVTNIALLYTGVAFCIGPAVLFGAMRDALARAERRLFLQAWQLRRLTGEEEPPASRGP